MDAWREEMAALRLDKLQELLGEGSQATQQVAQEALRQAHLWYQRNVSRPTDEALARLQWMRYSAGPYVPAPIDLRSPRTWLLLSEAVQALAAAAAPSGMLPPATAALLAANLAAFMKPGGWPLHEVALSPYAVVRQRQWYRLASAALLHHDAPHLLSNCIALAQYGSRLERARGSARFCWDVTSLALLSHSLYVATALVELQLLGRGAAYYREGGLGFSAIGFGLQVLQGYAAGGHVLSYECRVPAQYACWVSLAVTGALVPASSLRGHLCGIAAALGIVYLPATVRLLAARRGWRLPGFIAPRIYGAGTTSGQPAAPLRPRPTWGVSSLSWMDLATHGGCAAAALCCVFASRQAMQGLSRMWNS